MDIYPVLEFYGAENLPQSNGNWKTIRCPFHDDRNASARTNGTGFLCNGCGVKGDAIRIVEDRENVKYADAISFLEERVGQSCQELRKSDDKSGRTHRRSLLEEPRDLKGSSDLFSLGIRKRTRGKR